MTHQIVSGINESEIDELLKNRSSFEIVGLRGDFNACITHVEKRIESHGLKCRVKSDVKATLAQGGAFGAIVGLVSAVPTALAVAAIATASAAHSLATYDPDYEIIKDYVNKKLKITYKKSGTGGFTLSPKK